MITTTTSVETSAADLASDADQARAAPRPWLLGIALYVLTLAVYVPALGASFIWDDYQLIHKSPRVSTLQPILSYLGQGFWQQDDLDPGGQLYFRPLATLSLALDHQLHGMTPGGYHLTNLLLHASCALLLFGVLRRLQVGSLAAFALALGWAWFPRLSEAAAWISGRTDLIAALFVLSGLWFACGPSKTANRVWAAGCMLLGLLGKEVAAAGLVALIVKEWCASEHRSVVVRLRYLSPAVVAGLTYAVLRLRAIGGGLHANGLSWPERLRAANEALGHYFVSILDGWQPSVNIADLDHSDVRFVALGAACFVAAAVALVRYRHTLDAHGWMALSLFAISLGLVLHIVPVTVTVIAADRFLYLPLIALVLLAAPLARRRWPRWTSLVVAALVLSYAPITFGRAKLWADEVEFWAEEFRDKPDHNANSRLELGNVYVRAGLYNRAALLYLDADPQSSYDYLMCRNNLGTAMLMLGQYDYAVETVKGVVRAAPRAPKFQLALAIAYSAAGQPAAAEKTLANALELYPNFEAAKAYRQNLEELKQRGPAPEPTTTANRLLLAARAAAASRAFEAINWLVEATAAPDCPPREIEAAVLYAFDLASFRQLSALMKAYLKTPAPNPVILANFELRRERVQQLQALWPTLKPYRTRYPGDDVLVAKPQPAAAPAP